MKPYVVSLALWLTGCAAQPAAQAPANLADVYRLGKATQGQNLKVQGTFHGWAGCAASSQKTRSDWMVKEGEACIYVSGALPQGIVAPPATASNGMPVFIEGTVQFDSATGKPHLLLK